MGWINGIEVRLFDLSLKGIGIGALSFDDISKLDLAVDDETIIEFPGPDGTRLCLPLRIRRIDQSTCRIGATFSGISEQEYDAIEKLMFPRRIKGGP